MTASDAGPGCFKFKLPIFLQVQLKGGLGGGEWDYALTRTASDIRVRPQGCRPLAADAPAELRVRLAADLTQALSRKWHGPACQ